MFQRLKFALKFLVQRNLIPINDRGWITVFENYLGAFQQNVELRAETALSHPTVYACVTQIAADIGKLRLRLTEFKNEIWAETDSAAFSPVLRKPNKYQTRQKFVEEWIISKLIWGNTYILKERDNRNLVVKLYVLNPMKVQVLVSENGEVFYQLRQDNLSQVDEDIPAAPAYEIIHDTMECLFHPLVGIPPMFAGTLAVRQALNIMQGSASFFGNNSRPGGILTAPGVISEDTAKRLKAEWQANYSGANAGKVAVLGDGLKFEPIAQSAKDAELIDQLKWTDEKICSIFKVPPYKIYIGPMPTYDNAEILDKIYYAGCLQRLIEAIEQLLDEGLSLPDNYGTEFDLFDLMRMDSIKQMQWAREGIGGGVLKPDEGRKRLSLPPVPGGDTVYLQQQNYSLAALAERDRNAAPPSLPAGKQEDETVIALSRLNSKGVAHA